MRKGLYILVTVLGLCIVAFAYLSSEPSMLCGSSALLAPGASADSVIATSYSAEQLLWPVVAADCKATVDGIERAKTVVDWSLTAVLFAGAAITILAATGWRRAEIMDRRSRRNI